MDKKDLKRIANTVKAFENNPRNSVEIETHRPNPITGFWAELGESDGEKYSWKRIGWNADDEKFDTESDNGEGFNDEANYAIELDKCEDFPEGLVVWLTPVLGEDFLCFRSDDFFEGRSVSGGSGSTLQVELEFKSNYTGIIVSVQNRGAYNTTAGGWVLVNYLRGTWLLNASRC